MTSYIYMYIPMGWLTSRYSNWRVDF